MVRVDLVDDFRMNQDFCLSILLLWQHSQYVLHFLSRLVIVARIVLALPSLVQLRRHFLDHLLLLFELCQLFLEHLGDLLDAGAFVLGHEEVGFVEVILRGISALLRDDILHEAFVVDAEVGRQVLQDLEDLRLVAVVIGERSLCVEEAIED